MAYGTRFILDGKDAKGLDVSVVIKKKDYASLVVVGELVGDAVELTIGGLLSPNQYSPVRPFRGVAYAHDDGMIRNALSVAGQLEYQVTVIHDSNTIFRGWVEPVSDRVEPASARLKTNTTHRFVTEIGMVCGLSLLKFFPYADSDGSRYAGNRTIRQAIQECLAPLDLGLDLCYAHEWYTPEMEAGDSFLDIYYYNADHLVTEDGYVPHCDQVLQDIMVANAMEIMQWSTYGWVTLQLREYLRDTIPLKVYDSSMTADTDTSIDAVEVFTEIEKNARGGGDVHPVVPALDQTTITFAHGPTPPLIKNPTFETVQRGYDRETGDGALYNSNRQTSDQRGRDRATFSGNSTRPQRSSIGVVDGAVATEPSDYWAESDIAVSYTDPPTVVVGIGPDGENAVRLDPSTAGDGASSSLGNWFDDTDTYVTTGDPPFSTARKVVGGTGRQIAWQAAAYAEVDLSVGSGAGAFYLYPAYAEVFIKQGSTTRWLASDGSWDSSRAIIQFGEKELAGGIPANTWVTWGIISDDLPAGTWHLAVRLYNIVDRSGISALEYGYWTNVFADIVIDDIIRPSGEVVNVKRDSSLDLDASEFDVRFGTTPLVDMPGATVDENGVMADDIKFYDEYDDEQPLTGRSCQQAIAETMLRFQSQPLLNYRLHYLSNFPEFIPPCAALVIVDDSDSELARYRVADWTYNFGSSIQGGTLSMVEELTPSVTITRTPQPSE